MIRRLSIYLPPFAEPFIVWSESTSSLSLHVRIAAKNGNGAEKNFRLRERISAAIRGIIAAILI
jgi:hypothetical protein